MDGVVEQIARASVLVVDDNPLITGVLEKLLALESIEVISCSNGEEGLALLAQRAVDVIVCDVMMPKMDGYDFHTQVREKNTLSHIPFVFLTALSEQDELMKGHESGADDYLVKPFDPAQLISVVRGKIARSRNIRGATEHSFDDYRKRVIHTLSHEFRTPLVAINTSAELLCDKERDIDVKKVHNLLEAIRRGGLRLERLVNDFMCMQQIEAGIATRMIATRSRVLTCAEFLDTVAEHAAHHYDQLRLTKTNYAHNARLKVYEPYMLDVLMRLVDNAYKFSKNNKEITLCSYAQDSQLVIEVRDYGIGFDVEKVRGAIAAFGQIDREKYEQQGGGLGLTIASRYAGLHGGRLHFDSKPGVGSVVSIIVPCAE